MVDQFLAEVSQRQNSCDLPCDYVWRWVEFAPYVRSDSKKAVSTTGKTLISKKNIFTFMSP